MCESGGSPWETWSCGEKAIGFERVWCCLREEMWYNKEDKLEVGGEFDEEKDM